MKTIERHQFSQSSRFRDISSTYRLTFAPYDYKNEIQKLLVLVRNQLTEDILTKDWRNRQRQGLEGFCVPCSQAIQSLLNIRSDSYQGRLGKDWHWWLQVGDEIIDIVYEKSGEYEHSLGKKRQWYGWKHQIQIRSIKLVKRVLESDNRHYHEDIIYPSVSSQLPI